MALRGALYDGSSLEIQVKAWSLFEALEAQSSATC